MMVLEVPKIEGVVLLLQQPNTLKLSGTLTKREPSTDLGAFFRRVHLGAVARRLSDLTVDVTELTFVNSSSIRLFIDWAVWIKNEPTPYVLNFKTSRHVTWQATAFAALTSLMKDVVTVERI